MEKYDLMQVQFPDSSSRVLMERFLRFYTFSVSSEKKDGATLDYYSFKSPLGRRDMREVKERASELGITQIKFGSSIPDKDERVMRR